jgi:hypothetical protein
MIPGMIPGMAGQSGPALEYRTNLATTFAASSFTFTSVAIGPPSPTRLVVVTISGALGDFFGFGSATIGGVSATVVTSAYGVAGSANINCVMVQAVVPTGTTANVVVNWNRSIARCAIGVWTIDGVVSNTAVTSASGTGNSSTVDLSMNVQPNDAVIGGSLSFNNQPTTWVGLGEDFDIAFSTSRHSGASGVMLTAQSPRTISATSTQLFASVAAVWR